MDNNQQKLSQLKKEIEKKRKKLNEKLDDNYNSGNLDKEVIELSQSLDELLNRYLERN